MEKAGSPKSVSPTRPGVDSPFAPADAPDVEGVFVQRIKLSADAVDNEDVDKPLEEGEIRAVLAEDVSFVESAEDGAALSTPLSPPISVPSSRKGGDGSSIDAAAISVLFQDCFQCPKCGTQLRDSENNSTRLFELATKHLWDEHGLLGGPYVYPCPYCPHMTLQKFALEFHIEDSHRANLISDDVNSTSKAAAAAAEVVAAAAATAKSLPEKDPTPKISETKMNPETTMNPSSIFSDDTEACRAHLSCQFCEKKFMLRTALEAHLKTKHPFRSSARLLGGASLDAFLGLSDKDSATSPSHQSKSSADESTPSLKVPSPPFPSTRPSPYPWVPRESTNQESAQTKSLLKRKLADGMKENQENASPFIAKSPFHREAISDYTRQQLQQFLIAPRRETSPSGDVINNNNNNNNNFSHPKDFGYDAAAPVASASPSAAASGGSAFSMGNDAKLFGQALEGRNTFPKGGSMLLDRLSGENNEPNIPTAQEVNNMLSAAGFDLSPYSDAKRSGSLHCPQCPKVFDNVYSLRAHLKAVHLNIRPHKCAFCDKAFPQLWKLRQHTRLVHTHKGVRPFKCAYCSHASSLIHNCKAHIKQKHPGLEVRVVTESTNETTEAQDHSPDDGSDGAQGHEDELSLSHNSGELNVTLEGDDDIEVEDSKMDTETRFPSLLTKENLLALNARTEPMPSHDLQSPPKKDINDMFANRLAATAKSKSDAGGFFEAAFAAKINGSLESPKKKTLSSLFGAPPCDAPFPTPTSPPPPPAPLLPPVTTPPPSETAPPAFPSSSSSNRRKKSKPTKIVGGDYLSVNSDPTLASPSTAILPKIDVDSEPSPEDLEVADASAAGTRVSTEKAATTRASKEMAVLTTNFCQRLAPNVQQKEGISVYDETDRAFLTSSGRDDDEDDGLCDSPAPLKIDEEFEDGVKESAPPSGDAWEEGERDEMAQLAERKLREMKQHTLDLQTKKMAADYQRFIEMAKAGFAGAGHQETLNFLRNIQMLATAAAASSSASDRKITNGSAFKGASVSSSASKRPVPIKTTSAWHRLSDGAPAGSTLSGTVAGARNGLTTSRVESARAALDDEDREESDMMNGNAGEVSPDAAAAGASSVSCPSCPKLFSSPTYLKYHMDASHTESNKRFTCNFCGKKFPQSWKVQRHMRLVHTHKGVKEFQCGYCPHASALLHNCKSHIKAKHPGMEIKVIRLNPPELQQNSNATKLLTSGVAAAAAAAAAATNNRNLHSRAATPPSPPIFAGGNPRAVHSMTSLGNPLSSLSVDASRS